MRGPSIAKSLEEAEVRKIELLGALAQPLPSPVRLHPNLAEVYRAKVADLHNSLRAPSLRHEAIEIIRSLIEKIVVQPTSEGPTIELVGEICRMVELGLESNGGNKKAAQRRAALSATEASSAVVVAGAGFEPTTFRL